MVPKLWRKFGNVTVILQIVYSSKSEVEDPTLQTFIKDLELDGVLVRTVPSGWMDCILKSQLVRLFANDLVEDDDDLVCILMTSQTCHSS